MPSCIEEGGWNCPACGWQGGDVMPHGGRPCVTQVQGESIDGCPFEEAVQPGPGYVSTFSGKLVTPLDMRLEDICIGDIAHGLALNNRYNGQTIVPYSVAQHSVLVSLHCGENPREGLMHDSPEYVLPDVTRPIKPALVGFSAIESRLYSQIAIRFDLLDPVPDNVERVDHLIVDDERRWVTNSPIVPGPGLGIVIEPWPWDEAERRFLERFAELTA